MPGILNQISAQADCQLNNATLATLNTQEKFNLVQKLVKLANSYSLKKNEAYVFMNFIIYLEINFLCSYLCLIYS